MGLGRGARRRRDGRLCPVDDGSRAGLEPRGIVTDVRLKPGAVRRDVLVTTSGLFRDLYPNLINLIDLRCWLALAASAAALAEQHPELEGSAGRGAGAGADRRARP
ncbi:hypothetical protein LP420_35470 [Massilia sp. B-10]|nr:hypothetical protein LP420_35470 [Massilia sp. B-10]